ncbi:MAG: hypothetical protein ACE5GA_04305 [Candidatus Zixiibacteriota bacterium]
MSALFSKKSGEGTGAPPESGDSATALKMIVDGKERSVSFAELTLSNNLSQQALTRLLIKKGVFKAEELLEMMNTVRQENYRPPDKR